MLNTKTNEEGSSQRRGIIYNEQGIVRWPNSSSIINAFSETLMGDAKNTIFEVSCIGTSSALQWPDAVANIICFIGPATEIDGLGQTSYHTDVTLPIILVPNRPRV